MTPGLAPEHTASQGSLSLLTMSLCTTQCPQGRHEAVIGSQTHHTHIHTHTYKSLTG